MAGALCKKIFKHISKMLDVKVDGEDVIISGQIDIEFNNAVLIAASPIDRRSSYYGSGLPFPCASIAFSNPINVYKVTNKTFSTTFKYPNAFYMPNGIDRIPPTIYLIVDDKMHDTFILPDRFQLKTLSSRDHTYNIQREYYHGFKDSHLPIANAEIVMRTYAKFKQEYNIA